MARDYSKDICILSIEQRYETILKCLKRGDYGLGTNANWLDRHRKVPLTLENVKKHCHLCNMDTWLRHWQCKSQAEYEPRQIWHVIEDLNAEGLSFFCERVFFYNDLTCLFPFDRDQCNYYHNNTAQFEPERILGMWHDDGPCLGDTKILDMLFGTQQPAEAA